MCFGVFHFYIPLLTERDNSVGEAINIVLLRSKDSNTKTGLFRHSQLSYCFTSQTYEAIAPSMP